jgi:ABC-2 type transport system permease protein
VLWYKAWLETRSRFLTCLVTLTLFSAIFVHHAQGLVGPRWKSDSAISAAGFNRLLFVNQQYLVIMWVLAVVLLGMGGLVREKALGTSSLTLTLPVSRAGLLRVRIGMGVLEAIALGVVPWVAVLFVSLLAGQPILMTQVASYILLLLGGGLVYFAMAVLVSSSVGGEYTAPAVAFGIVLLGALLFDSWLRQFNVWRLVTGDFSIDRSTYLLSEHLPWLGILASLCVAVLMLLASTMVVERREF